MMNLIFVQLPLQRSLVRGSEAFQSNQNNQRWSWSYSTIVLYCTLCFMDQSNFMSPENHRHTLQAQFVGTDLFVPAIIF